MMRAIKVSRYVNELTWKAPKVGAGCQPYDKRIWIFSPPHPATAHLLPQKRESEGGWRFDQLPMTSDGQSWLGNEASGLPKGCISKESTCNAGDLGSTPGSGRSPGGGNGNPLQYSCLGNPSNRGAWRPQSRGYKELAHDWTCTMKLP